MKLSVIIPAYNEEQRIPPTLRATAAALAASHPGEHEILVVDDGSTDRTAAVVREIAQALPAIRLVESRPNRGKGHVVKVGMLQARGELRLFMDADNSTPITELPKLAVEIDRGAAVAIGSRRAPGAEQKVKPPLYRRLWSRLSNQVVQRLFLPGIRDTQCGFKLFTAGAAEEVFGRARETGWGFDLEILALAQRRGFAIAEVAVAWSDDRRSRIHPVRDAVKITGQFVRIRRNFARGLYD